MRALAFDVYHTNVRRLNDPSPSAAARREEEDGRVYKGEEKSFPSLSITDELFLQLNVLAFHLARLRSELCAISLRDIELFNLNNAVVMWAIPKFSSN